MEPSQENFAYTNHTLLPEALETWGEALFEHVLPRHMQIVREINRRFVEEELASKWPGDHEKIQNMSIVEGGQVRMAYLSVVGSHSVNGVAALHTKLLKGKLMKDFADLYPEKFNNKTNGITPRRWLLGCNPELAKLIDSVVGPEWVTNLNLLRGLEKVADDASFQEEFMKIKQGNKQVLAHILESEMSLTVDPSAIFDSQIAPLHEYKRQHLNLLHILTLYRRLLHDPDLPICPRVFIFGAKAAPGYHLAKVIIHAINLVARKSTRMSELRENSKWHTGRIMECPPPSASFPPVICRSRFPQRGKRPRALEI